MSKLLWVVTTCVVLALVAPATAAPEHVLVGPISPSGTVTIRVEAGREHGTNYRAYRLDFRGIPMRCEDGASTTDRLKEKIVVPAPLADLTWGMEGAVETIDRPGDDPELDYAWQVEGRAVAGRSAEGTVRVRDTAIRLPGGVRDSCRSGLLSWTAERVPAASRR